MSIHGFRFSYHVSRVKDNYAWLHSGTRQGGPRGRPVCGRHMAPLVLLMLVPLAQAISEDAAVSLVLERADTSASSPPCTGGACALELGSGPSSGEREDGPALLPAGARTHAPARSARERSSGMRQLHARCVVVPTSTRYMLYMQLAAPVA